MFEKSGSLPHVAVCNTHSFFCTETFKKAFLVFGSLCNVYYLDWLIFGHRNSNFDNCLMWCHRKINNSADWTFYFSFFRVHYRLTVQQYVPLHLTGRWVHRHLDPGKSEPAERKWEPFSRYFTVFSRMCNSVVVQYNPSLNLFFLFDISKILPLLYAVVHDTKFVEEAK